MNEQLKPYFSNHFQCNSCLKEFYQATAYAPNSSLKETYCFECVEAEVGFCSFQDKDRQEKCLNPLFNKKKQLCRSHYHQNYYRSWKGFNQTKKQSLEKSLEKLLQNLNQRDKRITGRTKQLNLKVKEQTYWRLKELALKNKCMLTEMLEKFLEGYGKKSIK